MDRLDVGRQQKCGRRCPNGPGSGFSTISAGSSSWQDSSDGNVSSFQPVIERKQEK